MVRNKILFSGQSNTFGLGLEVEFRPKYNDDEWLKENGLILPLPREPEDVYYWKKYRWTGLVCKELGYEEINIHDIEIIFKSRKKNLSKINISVIIYIFKFILLKFIRSPS